MNAYLSKRMKFKMTGLVLGVLVNSTVFAAASISTPEELIVLSVNGQEVKSSLFKGTKQFKVEAGPVDLNVRYQQYFELHNARFDIQKSGIINIKAPELKDNQNYKLVLVNPPQDEEEGRKFAAQPTIALFDQNNQLVVQQTGIYAEKKSLLDGGIFSKAVEFNDSKNTVNKQSEPVYAAQISSSKVNNQIASTTGVAASERLKNTVVSEYSDQKLIQVWQQASKMERQKFLSWLAEQ